MKKLIPISSFEHKGETLQNGEDCPHCGRMMEIYRVMLRKGHIQCLKKLYEMDIADRNSWHHYLSFQKPGFNSHSKLKYFGLVEIKPNVDNPKKVCSGMWRITNKGVAFLCGTLLIPKAVYVFNDTVLSIPGAYPQARVRITDIFPDAFDIRKIRTSEGI